MTKTNKFENEGYTIYIQGKHIEVTDALRSYVWEKLSRIERIADQIIDVHVVLDAQKLEKTCSIVMNFIRFHIKVQVGKDNMYEAIDKAVDRVVKLIRRYKTKLQSYRNKHLSTVDIHVNVIQPLKDDLSAINDDIEAENAQAEAKKFSMHKVVAKEMMPLKTLTQDEAIMKMEITSDPFMIFRSEEDQKLKVIYRREDENYGLVQVQ
ncbi:MAG: ribosome-associated translation inhibitor RaiA [Verrucomicrobia bacterium]|nr:ribosome-associated translation inhibitor RaiA [Verrucomicrobiota bacterium]MBU6446434.1 ribosome-associated translation inhibitor RaiA [Verrucomicrobiota bacterium]